MKEQYTMEKVCLFGFVLLVFLGTFAPALPDLGPSNEKK
jgi:hypothetical protein